MEYNSTRRPRPGDGTRYGSEKCGEELTKEGGKRPFLYPAVVTVRFSISRGVVDGPSRRPARAPVRLMVHLCQIVQTERGGDTGVSETVKDISMGSLLDRGTVALVGRFNFQ